MVEHTRKHTDEASLSKQPHCSQTPSCIVCTRFGLFENDLGPSSLWDCTVSFPYQAPLSRDSVSQLQPASQLSRERVSSCPAVRFWDKWESLLCMGKQVVFKVWIQAWDLKNPFSFPFARLFQRPELSASEPETQAEWKYLYSKRNSASFHPWLGCSRPTSLAPLFKSLMQSWESRAVSSGLSWNISPWSLVELPGGMESKQRWFLRHWDLTLNPDTPGVWKGLKG